MKTQLLKKSALIAGMAFSTISANAQGFQTSPTNWGIPVGGYYAVGNVSWGFNAAGGSASASNYANSQTWGVMDMDGDGKQDLVVCAQNDANADDKAFSPTSNPYWKVYLSNGTGFSSTATNWNIPVGGFYTVGNVSWGFNALYGTAAASNYANSQTWNTMDINGDGKPDLVVSAQNDASADDKTFSPTSNPYWKVYLNNGIGFSTTATNWTIPVGGYYTVGNVSWGFNAVAGSAAASSYANSQTWNTIDINGDAKPDLVVSAQNDASADDKTFSPTSNPYWKVYLNNGTGFSTTATNWTIPVGGYYTVGNVSWGFNAVAGSAAASSYANSQTWSTMDINGDSKPDLIVHAQNDASADDKVFSPASNAYWKVYLNNGTGFATSASNWNIPVGGYYAVGNVSWGFNAVAGNAAASSYNNSQTWTTLDVDGDLKPDLVVSAQNDANADDKAFSPTSNPYWKVYLNNGSGFSSGPTNWAIPVGGYYTTGNVNWGFNATAASATSSNYNNSQTWSTMDINGDKKADLIVHAQNDANADDKVFSPTSNPYWKVYLNSGVVGINTFEKSENNDVTIFPNPSNGKFMLLNKTTNEQINVSVYDMMGVCVLKATNATEIDLSNFAKGSYIAVMSNDKTVSTKKLILQ